MPFAAGVAVAAAVTAAAAATVTLAAILRAMLAAARASVGSVVVAARMVATATREADALISYGAQLVMRVAGSGWPDAMPAQCKNVERTVRLT